MEELDLYNSVRDFRSTAESRLPLDIFEYLEGGAEDLRTVGRNLEAYSHYQLRPRRLVDVSHIDTSVSLFGQVWESPVILAPVGLQGYFHPEGEMATARAAEAMKHLMMVSTVSNASYGEIAAVSTRKPWFQLYPTTNRQVTATLLRNAAENGCPVLVLTVDVPVLGNRQKHRKHLVAATKGGIVKLGNLDGVKGDELFNDPAMTWDMIDWIRDHCDMKIVLKGIMTGEDATCCLQHKVDGIIVSNHGGRQLESDMSTIECLEEVVQATGGEIPVLLDGGIRRGTDIVKAIALGADAVCIGRAFCYGLAVGGQKGVEKVLEIFREELVRDMQLLGVTALSGITGNYVREKKF